MSNFFIINPRFVFWKLLIPASATAYKRNSSSRKGSIKHIYKMSAFELITQHSAGLAVGKHPTGFHGMSLHLKENNEYIKKVLWKAVTNTSVNQNYLLKWPDLTFIFIKSTIKLNIIMTSIFGTGILVKRLNHSLIHTEKQNVTSENNTQLRELIPFGEICCCS